MTNGEKLKEVFPDIQIFNVTENEQREKFIHIRLGGVCQAIELEWWNAEYKEPTKNDLGVEEVTAFAEWTTAYSQGYADGVKSVNICPYCGEYIGEEE